MARPKRWVISRNHSRGVIETTLASWKYFADLINSFGPEFAETTVWRGQASARWALESTLDRLLRQPAAVPTDARARHLSQFQLACRGRRGDNPRTLSEDEWWALGQHYGLATPLLDWTRSPYVALYFAFEPSSPDDDFRAVWGLHRLKVEQLCATSKDDKNGADEEIKLPGEIKFLEPLLDENARLVNQGGLFTRAPDGMSIEDWAARAAQSYKRSVLTKLVIPNRGRSDCLRALNAMNINQRSLFPDLNGAAAFCNLSLQIPAY